LFLNADGTVTIAANTPAGNYILEYKICEVNNPSNCDSVTSTIVVSFTLPPPDIVAVIPDFTPTIEIDTLIFTSKTSSKDFVVRVSEISGFSSNGQLILKLTKGVSFTISYDNSNMSGSNPVNNNDWIITENSTFITIKLKPSVIIGANASSAIGFKLNPHSDIPEKTSLPITVTILNNLGTDNNNTNNTNSIVVEFR